MKALKKVIPIILITLLSVIICWPGKSYAAGGAYVSDTQIDVALGETAYIAFGVENAAGSYSVSSSGCIMANDSGWLDSNPQDVTSVTIGVYGASEGSGEVYIDYDIATYDFDPEINDYEAQSGRLTVYVNVYAPEGGYTGDYGKSGEDNWNADLNYDEVTQISDKLNIWLDDEPYSVLTDLTGVELPKGFTAGDGTFEGEKVKTVTYGSEIVMYALWNHWTGEVIFRTYDPQTQEFGEPASFKQGNRTYYLLKIPGGTEVPEGYKKSEISLNDHKTEALVSEKKGYEDIYYIYAMTDGESSFYSYDKKEGTLQRTVELKPMQEEETQPEKAVVKQSSIFSNKMFLIVAGAAALIIIILIILLIHSHRKFKDLTEDDY